jgi:hypothetical protein
MPKKFTWKENLVRPKPILKLKEAPPPPPKPNDPRGTVDLPALRKEIKDSQKQYRKPL